MTLVVGKSRKSIGKNIRTEESAGRSPEQALAIALHTADEVRKKRQKKRR